MDIIVFGCGDACNKYLQSIMQKQIKILAFLDNDSRLWERKLFGIAEIVPPAKIAEYKYDYIIVASNVNDEKRVEIIQQLKQYGVDQEKVTFYPEKFAVDYNPRIMFFKNYARYMKENNISGNIAECGVGTGETAKYINRYFPERKLYLFDTFESYPNEAVEMERKMKNFNEETLRTEKFKQTSVELVREILTFPEQVFIKQGLFPDTAKDIDEMFGMIHLDMTLYKSTLDAFEFFWPKLSKNGVILVRDYYAQALPGPRCAVDEYEKEKGINFVKIPIGDTTSIAIIKTSE